MQLTRDHMQDLPTRLLCVNILTRLVNISLRTVKTIIVVVLSCHLIIKNGTPRGTAQSVGAGSETLKRQATEVSYQIPTWWRKETMKSELRPACPFLSEKMETRGFTVHFATTFHWQRILTFPTKAFFRSSSSSKLIRNLNKQQRRDISEALIPSQIKKGKDFYKNQSSLRISWAYSKILKHSLVMAIWR